MADFNGLPLVTDTPDVRLTVLNLTLSDGLKGRFILVALRSLDQREEALGTLLHDLCDLYCIPIDCSRRKVWKLFLTPLQVSEDVLLDQLVTYLQIKGYDVSAYIASDAI